MSFFATTDFFFDVAQGLRDGYSLTSVVSRIPSTALDTFEDIWGIGGEMTAITSAESYEVVSDNANDTTAGTGGIFGLVLSLDEDYNEQQQFFTLNGTTPVAIGGTHIRPRQILILSSGSSNSNEGTITLRVASGGDTRNTILPGFSNSQDSQFTIPAGKTGYIRQFIPSFPKNQDGVIRNILLPTGVGSSKFIGIDIPFYQAALIVPSSFTALPEKTDISFQVKTSNSGVEVPVVIDYILVDN